MTLDRDALLRLHWFMRLTRALEDRTRALYNERKIVGAVYTGAGMEATSVGAAFALRPGDVISPLHRDLGAHLVRGITPREVLCQWLGRGNSLTLGRDSRLHFGDMRRRMIIPANGMVGATLPVAVGTALASKMRGEGRVTLAFIGDGGTSTGDFHEALNLAASAWVPFVCVIENNGYAYSTPTHVQTRLQSLAQRAAAYGIPGVSVDGNDARAVHQAVHEAVEHARGGGGPALIEARTFRMSGHSEADPAAYVPARLLVEWAERDPITRYETALLAEGILSEDEKAAILTRIGAEVDDALRFAEASPPPDPATLAVAVYSDDGTGIIKPRRLPETPAVAPLGADAPADSAASARAQADLTHAEMHAGTDAELVVARARVTRDFGDDVGDDLDEHATLADAAAIPSADGEQAAALNGSAIAAQDDSSAGTAIEEFEVIVEFEEAVGG